MLETGDPAPDFDLTGVTAEGEMGAYRLTAAAQASPVVLVFYPFDFGPASTQSLQSLQAVDWAGVTDGVAVYGISPDGIHAHRAFADAADLAFPLLVDRTAYVAEQFEVMEEEDRPGQPLIRLSAFVVDRDCRVTYAWQAQDPEDTVDADAIRRAVSDVDSAR